MPTAEPNGILKLQFGSEQEWQLERAGRAFVLPSYSPGAPVDIVQAVDTALTEPLGFPSMDQAIVPGDQVVFVTDATIANLAEVLVEVLRWFAGRGVSQTNMKVVLADATEHVTQWVQSELQAAGISVGLRRHEADDAEHLAYLAAAESSEPIYLNRWLVDADVVIPITCPRPAGTLDGLGSFGIFPLITDRKTRGKILKLASLQQEKKRDLLADWADQATWWLGVLAGISIVPNADGQVSQILAGAVAQLEEASLEAHSCLWESPADEESAVDSEADLVLALVQGPAHQQTWLNVARSLYAALHFVKHRGSVVLFTEMPGKLGPALKRLRQVDKTPEEIAEQLEKDASDDALAAEVILKAVADHHIYLVSKLRKDATESLGLGHIVDARQLSNLLGSQSCIVLTNAPCAIT